MNPLQEGVKSPIHSGVPEMVEATRKSPGKLVPCGSPFAIAELSQRMEESKYRIRVKTKSLPNWWFSHVAC